MVGAPPTSALGWFAPPVLPTTSATLRARGFHKVAWTFFGVLTALLLAASAVTPGTLMRRIVSVTLVGVLILPLHALNRRGRTELASWILVIGLIAVVTQRAWNTGGVHGSIPLFYMLFVLMGAGLLGARGGFVSAAACMLSATFLLGAELAGSLDPVVRQIGSPAEGYIAVVLAMTVTLLSLTLLRRKVEEMTTEDLVNMFVHDMRSPLTVLMARLSMLKNDLPDTGEFAEHTSAAMLETVRLNRMSNNLLDISRLSGANLPLHRARTDVPTVARCVATALAALDPDHQIEIRAQGEVMCGCDPEVLLRIIENLVSNAIKHGTPKGTVIVEVTAGQECVRIVVQDDGPGIPVEARERIFDRYSSRGISTANGYHSVGLGLAFCKLAVKAHAGRIWVEDASPRGSRFVVELPSA